ncbi:hypothetical protein ACQPZA_19620 [Pseudonocardia xinjiangensis]|uniref:hypothetical protein n=1 Tax=Pseudonocardia xinjiangensis TaxID=75289 RepID=UPI003D912CA9
MDDGGGGQGGRGTPPGGARRPVDRRLPHRQDREKPPTLRTGDDPPPPAREQLPLPRRRRQAHLEPQLRNPGGGDAGTPFSAFSTTNDKPAESSPDATVPTTGPDAAAAFHSATRRGRMRRRPRFFEG